MAKKDPAQELVKQLQALERVHGRLVVLNSRIRVQGEIIADLVKLAEAAAAEAAPPPGPPA
jgi:thiamine monophosphate synthase